MKYLKLFEMYSKSEELEKFLTTLGVYKFLDIINSINTDINDDIVDSAEILKTSKSKLNINLVPKKQPMNLKTLSIDFINVNELDIDDVKKSDFFKFIENIKHSSKIIFSINWSYDIYIDKSKNINERINNILSYYKNVCEFEGYIFRYIPGFLYYKRDLDISRYIEDEIVLDMRKRTDSFGFTISSEVDSNLFLEEMDISFVDEESKKIINEIISKYKITKLDKDLLYNIIKESI